VICAVLFDLDDTLYPQSSWLTGALTAVADAGSTFGADRRALLGALRAVADQGSDRGRVIDRALAQCGCTHIPVPPLVDAFRTHAPRSLRCYPGVAQALTRLREHVPIGIVTDGDVSIQQSKLRALHLDADVVVFSDAHGRTHRKPDPIPFRHALAALGVGARQTVFIGDRPDKDIVGAMRLGMRAIRVRTGEYATLPDAPQTWATAQHVVEAIEGCLAEIERASAERHALDGAG
jgi:putative hydrolase of the HAD superfamily